MDLFGSYLTVEALRKDLLKLAKKNAVELENTIKILSDNSFEGRFLIAIAIHIVIGGLFLFVIWKNRRMNQYQISLIRSACCRNNKARSGLLAADAGQYESYKDINKQ